jgi:hypothetical protein
VSTLELSHLWPPESRESLLIDPMVPPMVPPSVPTAPVSARHSGGKPPERRFLPEGVPIDLPSLERLAIQEALRRVNGNRTHAARLLGISLRTLRNKLRDFRAQAASADGQLLPGSGGAFGGEYVAVDVEDGAANDPGLAQPSHPSPDDSDRDDQEQAA